MLQDLGQITSEEINRLEKAAVMQQRRTGMGLEKYAWCSDRTRDERERGISTHALVIHKT
jgi:translation elongation factor EF-1alpha